MTETNGPTRIIMIHSGKYEYAEVDVNEGIHLVGANNCGKTTLISTLQFLYIDKENAFKFSHDRGKSRRYYFKDEYSYILFECMTSAGYKVIGARGTSSLGSGDFERFIYNGSYKSEDFFRGDEIIKGNEVKVNLAVKGYKILTANLLQAALTGKDIGGGLVLNLLPIKSTDGYEKFRNTYKNLLELSTIGQSEVKEALIQICSPKLVVKNGIDLQESYAPMYNKIRRVLGEIEDIKKLKPLIEDSHVLFGRREEARTEMVAGYQMIIESLKSIKIQNIKRIETLKIELEEKEEARKGVEDEHRETEKIIGEKNQEIGAVLKEIENLKKEIEKFQGYLPSLELPQINQLALKFKRKASELALIDIEDVEIIETRLNNNEVEFERLNRRVSNFENTLARKLSTSFTKDQLSKVFGLFNHKLLDQNTVNGTVEILNYDGLVRNINTILSKVKDETYNDDAVSVSLIEELKPDLSDFFDIKKVKELIAHKKSEIERDKKTLVASKKKKELQEEYDALQDELTSRKQKHSEYLAFKEKKSLKELEKDQEVLESEKREKREKLTDLYKRKDQLQTEITILGKRIMGIGEEEKELDRKVSLLQKPDSDWTAPDDDHHILEDDINSLIEAHGNYGDQEKATAHELEKNLYNIERILGPKVSYGSDKKFLEYLKLQVDELAQKEAVVEEMWDKALTSLQTSLRDILEDVEMVSKQAGEINRTLSKIQISDLVSVRIIVEKKKHLTDYIKTLIRSGFTTNLLDFANTGRSTEPLKELQGRFLGKGKVELTDLFALKFEVEKIDGKIDPYTSLNNVESNGTTTTIKVLVNLILMKGLFDEKNKEKVRIPFYLDEVANLDPHNARAVTQKAVELGFTPIVASPAPAHIVNKLYLLKGGRKEGLYVNDRNMTYIQRN
jgi:energy-coupling factor transporter ATP-binding protein EcfA2